MSEHAKPTAIVESMIAAAKNPVAWVMLAAVGIRFFACLTTHIVNPDGVQYIQQSKALYFSGWHAATECTLPYITPLPILMALVFPLFKEWVAAGRAVTLFFSVATLIPLYHICKQFFNKDIAAMTLLVYAMIPVFAGRSADIVRGPVFWFCLSMGMYLFTRAWDSELKGRRRFFPPLSCFFFLVATWTRFEGAMFVAVSLFYLIIWKKQQRLQFALHYAAPIIMAVLACLLYMLAAGDAPLSKLPRPERFQQELSGVLGNYDAVRATLKHLADQHAGPIGEFFRQAKDALWLIPIGAMINCIVEKFFYPYVLIFIVGCFSVPKQLKKNPASYFNYLVVASLFVLYLHLINTWLIYDRFLAIMILPAALLIGAGCGSILAFLERKAGVTRHTAVILLVVFIVGFGLGKNMRPRYEEKAIFKQMGDLIARREGHERLNRVAAVPSTAYNWVFFYANRGYQGASCGHQLIGRVDMPYAEFIPYLKTNDIDYVLWSEKTWPAGRLDIASDAVKKNFEIMGRWEYEGSDTFLLLKII